MRLLVCGSRTYGRKIIDNKEIEDSHACQLLYSVLSGIRVAFPDLTVFAGGAPGADTIAAEWAAASNKIYGVEFVETKADWKQYGKAAGPMRNQLQLDRMLAKKDKYLGLAFVDKSLEISKGTYDMVVKMRKANIDVGVIEALK